jgi:cytosine/adenosine deaminase-related metal-dependent hydrolase
MILRARVVLPICGPAIRDGAISIRGNRITAVSRWRDLAKVDDSDVTDLGRVVLLPGLINAHCHLDYTHMAGHFAPPKSFTEWLRQITGTKAGWALSDYADSWQAGAEMLLRSGTTTVADIEAVPQLLPKAWSATPLRVFSLLEMIGFTARNPARKVLAGALKKMARLRHPRSRIGLSPHAPYSTSPELYRLTARAAEKRHCVVCTHVSEALDEFSMFRERKGEMYDWFAHSGRDMSDCGLGTPIEHLKRCGLLRKNLMVAHANCLGRNDARVLARNHVSVIHCPRSHHYFKHEQFLLRRLLKARVNVCLGTDSLASIYTSKRQPAELNMFDEMRALKQREHWLSARQILRMTTMNGARALGMQGELGQLSPGAFADLIAIRLPARSTSVYDGVLHHKGPVEASMINGEWAIPPENSQLELPELHARR